MVVNTKTINRPQAPLQIHEMTIGVTKCTIRNSSGQFDLARSCYVTLRKPIRKRNNTSAMIQRGSEFPRRLWESLRRYVFIVSAVTLPY